MAPIANVVVVCTTPLKYTCKGFEPQRGVETFSGPVGLTDLAVSVAARGWNHGS